MPEHLNKDTSRLLVQRNHAECSFSVVRMQNSVITLGNTAHRGCLSRFYAHGGATVIKQSPKQHLHQENFSVFRTSMLKLCTFGCSKRKRRILTLLKKSAFFEHTGRNFYILTWSWLEGDHCRLCQVVKNKIKSVFGFVVRLVVVFCGREHVGSFHTWTLTRRTIIGMEVRQL